MNYGATVAFMRRANIGPNSGSLRLWAEVETKLNGRLVSPYALQLLTKHLDPAVAVTTPAEVPAEVMMALRVAWDKISARGSDLVVEKAPVKSGQPRKEAPARMRRLNGGEGFVGAHTVREQLTAARLAIAEEQLRYKKLQTDRLAGMMCDKATVEDSMRQLGLIIQRWLIRIPAKFSGKMVKLGFLSDAQLRELEKSLHEEVPVFLRELKADTSAAVSDAVAVASARRYGDKNWSAEVGTA
jgi:hypothetical protein